jgi:hypothetical protein
MAELKVHIQLSESEILGLCHLLDNANYGLDVGYGDKDLALRRRLHTALTLARIKSYDKED